MLSLYIYISPPINAHSISLEWRGANLGTKTETAIISKDVQGLPSQTRQ